MRPITKIFIFLLLCSFAAASSLASASHYKNIASPAVPLSSDLYDRLDLLEAHKLISQRFLGLRPYTRAQFAEFTVAAKEFLADHADTFRSEKTESTIALILGEFESEFSDEIAGFTDRPKFSVTPMRSLRVDTTAVKSDPRPYFQLSSSSYAPLTAFSGGRHFADGVQSSVETEHELRYGAHFSASVTPRLQLQFLPNGENKIFLQEGYVTTKFLRHRLDAGRRPLTWGLGRHGGIFLSDNARPLDSVQLTNDDPWSWGALGLFRYNFFLANLGSEYNPSKAYLAAYKLSLSPKPWLEMSLFRGIIFGGRGAPSGSFGEMILEYVGYRSGDINSINRSNSITGVEAKARIDSLRGLEIYGESSFDDLSKAHFFRSWIEDNGVLLGLFLPRIDDAGTFSARLEFRRLNPIMYKHYLWKSGWTENRFILGDPLGPDSESLALTLRKFFLNPDMVFEGQFALERVDSDTYTGSNVQTGHVVAIDGNAETRLRGQVSGKRAVLQTVFLGAELGYERVNGYNFKPGDARNNALFRAFLEWRPEPFAFAKRH